MYTHGLVRECDALILGCDWNFIEPEDPAIAVGSDAREIESETRVRQAFGHLTSLTGGGVTHETTTRTYVQLVCARQVLHGSAPGHVPRVELVSADAGQSRRASRNQRPCPHHHLRESAFTTRDPTTHREMGYLTLRKGLGGLYCEEGGA